MDNVFRFLSEVKIELQKVAWPSTNELIGSVIVVYILLAAFSVYLGLIDFFFYSMAERFFI